MSDFLTKRNYAKPSSKLPTFGMLMPNRAIDAEKYRFGFNDKENDNELKGIGNQQDYGMRIYDGRINRFLSVDPLKVKFPFYTPYQFSGNKAIAYIDLDGLEDVYFNNSKVQGNERAIFKVIYNSDIKKDIEKFQDLNLNNGYDLVIVQNSALIVKGADAQTFQFRNNNGLPRNVQTNQVDVQVLNAIEQKGRGIIIIVMPDNSFENSDKDASAGNWVSTSKSSNDWAHEFLLHTLPFALGEEDAQNPRVMHQKGFDDPNTSLQEWNAQDDTPPNSAAPRNSIMGKAYRAIKSVIAKYERTGYKYKAPMQPAPMRPINTNDSKTDAEPVDLNH